MKKRIMAMVIILNLIAGCVVSFGAGFSDLPESIAKESIERLVSLEIIAGYEDGTFRPEKPITRAEFMTIMARVLGVSKIMQGNFDSDIFLDVPGTHWAAGNIKYGVDNEIISGYGNGYFGPDDLVTYEQAFKILFNAMGYESVAQDKGGYPDGYTSLALEHGITKGISVDFTQSGTRENIAYIIDKAMDVNVLEKKISTSDKDTYIKTNKTLLTKLLALKNGTIRNGIITANMYTDVETGSELEENQVIVKDTDGNYTLYQVADPKITDYLGYRVEFYANISEELNIPTITSVTLDKNEEFILKAEDIERVSLAEDIIISYEESSRQKELKLKSNILTVYNNRFSATDYTDFDIRNGYIKFVDNNKDGRYDIAFINEYFSFMVEKVSKYTETIFLKDMKYNGLTRLSLESEKDGFYYTIKNVDGQNMELSDLSENDVCSVMSDKEGKCISIIVSNNTVDGAATVYDDETVTISGKEYSIGVSDEGNKLVNIDLGREGKWFIDVYGAVVGFEENETIIDNVGYIVKKGYKNRSTPNETLELKLLKGNKLTEKTDDEDKIYYEVGNSNFELVTLLENVIVNGKKKQTDELDTLLPVGTLIRYSVNSDGYINKIEFPEEQAVDAKRNFNSDISSFGGAFYAKENTVVICVPEDVNSSEDDYYTKVYLENTKKYLTSGFDIDPDTKVADFVIITTAMKADVGGTITNSSDIFIVTKSSVLYENEESVLRLEGYQNGEKIQHIVKSDARIYTIATGLTAGSVIYYSLNSQGLIDNIEVVEDIYPEPGYFHKDSRSANERVYGKLHKIERDELSETTNTQRSEFIINIAEGESETPELITVTSDTKNDVPVYVVNSAGGKVSVADIYDMYSVEEVGYEKATKVFICKKKYEVKGIVIIK